MDDGFVEKLSSVKRESVLQLLFRCARLCNERAMGEMRKRSNQHEIREAHTRMFPHIDLEGTRLTVLAGRLGVSKQAASQWVDELVVMGVLEKVPDPSDGRARLIRFSEVGRQSMLDGIALLIELEQELAAMIGPDDVKQLHAILLRLNDQLEASEHTNGE